MSPRTPAPASSTPRPATAPRTSKSWKNIARLLEARGIDTKIPFTVDEAGFFTKDAPGFEGKRVIDDKGKFGDANFAVIAALIEAGALIARARHKHDYPHSWRSKKPVIFRATPQWFIAMDKAIAGQPRTRLRSRALKAIDDTRWVPPQGENRITGMIETRPDWVVSRQRAWGVPITVFRHKETGEVIPRAGFNGSTELIERIVAAFRAEGADAWFKPGAKRALPRRPGRQSRRMGEGRRHSRRLVQFRLDPRLRAGEAPRSEMAGRRSISKAPTSIAAGSNPRCWNRAARAAARLTTPCVTHGFVVDEDGRKMSKSLGNVVAPQDVIRQSGAEILRLWAMSSDYAEDLRIGPDIIKANVESYRKLRNTLRFLLGNLAHYRPELAVPYAEMPELERYMLARLAELDVTVRAGYDAFDFKRVFHALLNFCVNDLSAFYFDIRKDALYCDPYDSVTRRAALTVLDRVFERAHRLARADALLHHGGGMAQPLPRRQGLGASPSISRDPERVARRGARREMAQGARGAPRRHRRARDRAERGAHRLEPGSGAQGLCRRQGPPRRAARRRSRRDRHHQRRASCWSGEGPDGCFPPR